MDFFKPTIAKFAVLIIFFNVIPFIIGKILGLGAFLLIVLIPSYWLAHVLILIGLGDFIRTTVYEILAFAINTSIAYLLSCFIVFLADTFTGEKSFPKKKISIGIAIFAIVLLAGMSMYYLQFGLQYMLKFIISTGIDLIVIYVFAYLLTGILHKLNKQK